MKFTPQESHEIQNRPHYPQRCPIDGIQLMLVFISSGTVFTGLFTSIPSVAFHRWLTANQNFGLAYTALPAAILTTIFIIYPTTYVFSRKERRYK